MTSLVMSHFIECVILSQKRTYFLAVKGLSLAFSSSLKKSYTVKVYEVSPRVNRSTLQTINLVIGRPDQMGKLIGKFRIISPFCYFQARDYAQRDASFRTVRGSNQSVDVINISACSHAHHYSEINENRHPQKRLNLVNSRGYLENGTSGYFSGDPSSSEYGSYYSSSTASSSFRWLGSWRCLPYLKSTGKPHAMPW